jgi:oxygen-independent coproporphyrinogen-3 oxidase
LYCSFTAYPVAQYQNRIDAYLEALFHELDYVAQAYRHKRLVAVYMGGGTPTALPVHQLARLIDYIWQVFDTTYVKEFTIEAGRPDSVSEATFRMMKERPVTRISINPQTMNDETLAFIGRAHTTQMTIDAYRMARACGMDNINMDMIVGLPNETLPMIQHTLDGIRELQPDSLTVHSLALKRSAELNIQIQRYQNSITGSTDEMLRMADDTARTLGMHPYYLYRQKNIPGNLENVGYAKPGKECLYNILIMEEKMDIIAVGAGTSTKMVYPDSIGRIENVKNVEEYIARIDEMIERKRVEFEKNRA